MAKEHGRELYPLREMADDEIRDLVIDHLTDEPQIDPELIDVQVSGGRVTVAGRLGTDAEVQIVESLLSDLIGIESFQNDLVVDELSRGEAPMGADDDLVRDAETHDPLVQWRGSPVAFARPLHHRRRRCSALGLTLLVLRPSALAPARPDGLCAHRTSAPLH